MATYKRDPILDQFRETVPSDEKHSTQVISIFVGAILTIVGFAGLLYSEFAGLNLGPLHALIIAVAGSSLLYSGYNDKGRYCFLECITFGSYFFLISLAGFFLGGPGTPATAEGTFGKFDEKLLVIIPRFFELGFYDHIANLIIGLVLLGGAFDWWRRNHGMGGVI